MILTENGFVTGSSKAFEIANSATCITHHLRSYTFSHNFAGDSCIEFSFDKAQSAFGFFWGKYFSLIFHVDHIGNLLVLISGGSQFEFENPLKDSRGIGHLLSKIQNPHTMHGGNTLFENATTIFTLINSVSGAKVLSQCK